MAEIEQDTDLPMLITDESILSASEGTWQVSDVSDLGMQVMPVLKWDSTDYLQTKPFSEPGILTLALRALLEEDMDPTTNRFDLSHPLSPM